MSTPLKMNQKKDAYVNMLMNLARDLIVGCVVSHRTHHIPSHDGCHIHWMDGLINYHSNLTVTLRTFGSDDIHIQI